MLIPDSLSSEHTDWTLKLALPSLERAAGRPVECLTGVTGDPFDAVREELLEGTYDRVIISTLPSRVSKWLRRDLLRPVEALAVHLYGGRGAPGECWFSRKAALV